MKQINNCLFYYVPVLLRKVNLQLDNQNKNTARKQYL